MSRSQTGNRWALWAVPALLLGLPFYASFAQGPGQEEVRKKLDEIRKQISDLREKEKALLEREQVILKIKAEEERQARQKEEERKRKEAEEAAKREIVEKGKHYIKVEIRGKLVRVMGPYSPSNTYLLINEVYWPLSFQDAKGLNKALLAEAEKHLSKHVIVTGSITTKTPPFTYGTPNLPGGPQWQPWDQPAMPPDWKERRFFPYTPPVAVNPTVIVESIKLAS